MTPVQIYITSGYEQDFKAFLTAHPEVTAETILKMSVSTDSIYLLLTVELSE